MRLPLRSSFNESNIHWSNVKIKMYFFYVNMIWTYSAKLQTTKNRMFAAENGCREWSYHVREMGHWPDKARLHYVYKHGVWKEVWRFVAKMKIDIQKHHHKTSTVAPLEIIMKSQWKVFRDYSISFLPRLSYQPSPDNRPITFYTKLFYPVKYRSKMCHSDWSRISNYTFMAL